ncbi:MAG: hypothetical protein AAGF12_28030 [Myxococcota bacterium]
MFQRLVGVTLGLLALSPAGAEGQSLNYQTFLIGDRALGMGGAFTGLADDASASYYNPAGLAMLVRSSISGSLQVNAFDRYIVRDGFASPIGSTDLDHESNPTVPLFVGLVKKFGNRHPDRVRRHAIALSTVHPTQVRRNFSATLENPMTGVETTLSVRRSDTVRWWGPSYAYRVTPRFALGVSAFLSTRSFEHEEDEVIITQGTRDPTGVFRNSTLSIRESLVEIDDTQIVLRIGAIYDHGPFRFGLTFQPPAIPISGSSTINERRSFADLLADPPAATFFRSDQGGLDSSSPIPWELRLGASYTHGPDFHVALDVSVYGPVGSEDDPVVPFGFADPDPITGEVPQPGIFAVQQYHANVTANMSLGMETVIAGVVPVRAGVFTDFSAAPDVPEASDILGPDQVNHYGASLSVGLRAGGYDLSVGAAVVYGRGEGYRLNPQPGLDPTPETYLAADVESRTVYFFISGAQQAAGRLAKSVYDEYIRPGS